MREATASGGDQPIPGHRPEHHDRRATAGAQPTALRHFGRNGTDDASHKERGSMIRHYIIWRNPSRRRPAATSRGREGERCLMRHWLLGAG
ncbi:hypothetical protein ACIOHO_39930 [Streptomyces sp. NPDC087849]|uniref:hypothetical protein n=1 Tax=Streptomyces sp. NPDC087849 TaxID=3365808 RepID=UPI003829D50A